MREIKFRAWDTIHDEMSNTFTIIDCIDHTQVFMLPENFIFMQYTGLKDKNGVEIYEGDRIGYRLFNGMAETYAQSDIVYRDGAFIPYDIDSADKDYMTLHQLMNSQLLASDDDIEVIGNIYQTPELLETA